MKKRDRKQIALENPSWYTPHPNSMLARAFREGGTEAAKVIKSRKEAFELSARRYENQLITETYGATSERRRTRMSIRGRAL